jgi:hypothetical protein
MRTNRYLCLGATLACLLLSAKTAQAQFDELSRGLYLAGFRINATPNPITHGVDFTTSRSFFPGSNTLNFGVGTLTLNGGMTISGDVTRRPIPGLTLGISSTASPGVAAQPMTYTLSIPRAVENITVSGTATFNTQVTVDESGFYHRVLSIDNRGTLTTSGLTNTTKNLDYTIGPIDQTGNVVLEGLGNLLNGKTTSTTTLASVIDTKPLTQADVDALDLNNPDQVQAFINAALVQGISQAAMDPSIGTTTTTPKMAAVPEPATLALLALAGSFCIVGWRRRHAA